jgi:hypothetical protein
MDFDEVIGATGIDDMVIGNNLVVERSDFQIVRVILVHTRYVSMILNENKSNAGLGMCHRPVC